MSDIEVMRALFPKESEDERNAGVRKGIIKTAKRMKEENLEISVISKATELSPEEIEEL